jgi:low temperature requirement protein LtrA
LGSFFKAALTTAFEGFTQAFPGAVSRLQCGASPSFLHVRRNVRVDASARLGVLLGTAMSTALWIIGANAEPERRVWWLLPAAVLDLTGVWSGHRLPGRKFRTVEVPFTPAHVIDRSRLWLIIALGETVLTTPAPR